MPGGAFEFDLAHYADVLPAQGGQWARVLGELPPSPRRRLFARRRSWLRQRGRSDELLRSSAQVGETSSHLIMSSGGTRAEASRVIHQSRALLGLNNPPN